MASEASDGGAGSELVAVVDPEVDPDCDPDCGPADPLGDEPPTDEGEAVEEGAGFGVEVGVTLEPAVQATASPAIRTMAQSCRLAGRMVLGLIGVPFVVVDRIGRSLHRATVQARQRRDEVVDATARSKGSAVRQ